MGRHKHSDYYGRSTKEIVHSMKEADEISEKYFTHKYKNVKTKYIDNDSERSNDGDSERRKYKHKHKKRVHNRHKSSRREEKDGCTSDSDHPPKHKHMRSSDHREERHKNPDRRIRSDIIATDENSKNMTSRWDDGASGSAPNHRIKTEQISDSEDHHHGTNEGENRQPRREPAGGCKWGKKSNNEEKVDDAKAKKEKVNFGLSGKLTEDTNTYKGIVIKYSQPPEARKPKRRWRWYIFKGDDELPFLPLHRQSAYLIGRERKVADIPTDHPSCSKQHAVLQYRLVTYDRADGSKGRTVKPYILDLESANGTFVNNKRIEARKYFELIEKDVVKFGYSSREYVLLHEASKGSDEEIPDTGNDLSPISLLRTTI